MQGGIAFSQVYTLPSVLFDSLVFETRKGRSCDSLQVLNENIIKEQGQQLLNYGDLVRLNESKIVTLEGLVKNYETGESLLKQENKIREKWLKEKIKRLWKVIVLEGGVILVILLL